MQNGFASVPLESISSADVWKSTAEEFGDGVWWYSVSEDKIEVSDNWRRNLSLPNSLDHTRLQDWIDRIIPKDKDRVSEQLAKLIRLEVLNLNLVYTVHDRMHQSFEILHRFSIKNVDSDPNKAAMICSVIIPNAHSGNYESPATAQSTSDIHEELLAEENAERSDTYGRWSWNVKENTQCFDTNYRAMLGYGPNELPDGYLAWQSIVFKEDAITALLNFETHLVSKGTHPCINVCRYRHKSGKTLYIKSRAKVTQWTADGNPLIVEGIHIDVTLEHEAHRELERLKLLLEQTSRAAKVGGWQFTPSNNELMWTATTYEIHELDQEEHPHIEVESAINFYKEGYSRDRIKELVNSSLKGPFSYTEELQIITAKGNERWVRAQGVSEFKNGECVRMYGAFQDIHEKKLADMRLKAEEAKFRELYESSPIAITKNELDSGRFLDINAAGEAMFGYTAAELRDLTYNDLTPEEYHDADRIQVEILKSKKRFGPIEKEYIKKDGSRCDVQLSGFLVENEGGEPLIWALIQDISERKNSERAIIESMKAAEKANYAKSAFLAAMSHEIRTPLNGIIGSTELLRETNLDEGQEALIKMVLNSGDALLSTVSDVLDYSKIEAGQMQLEESEFAPLDIAEQVLDIMTPKARAAGIEIGVIQSPSCPEYLLGDPTRIRQILINFTGNAVKFTHEGYVELGIDYSEEEGLQFWVRDTGIGIEEDKLKEIFKPFTQADISTTRKYGGSGLGLAISKSLCNLMNGEMRIESELGEGSVFSLILPLKPSQQNDSSDLERRRPLNGSTGLIIETSAFTDRLIANAIQSGGGTVLSAADFQTAEAIMNEEKGVDFIIAHYDFLVAHAQGTPRSEDLISLFKTPFVAIEDRATSKTTRIKTGYTTLEKPLKTNQILQACRAAIQTESGSPNTPRKSTKTIEQVSRALIVEDNFTNKALLERMLQKLGVPTVDHAENGKIAVDFLNEPSRADYDIIFMDCQMPVMSGYEATIAIRDMEKCGDCSIRNRIVGVSAGAMEGDAEHAIGVGMDDYITKPFRIDSIRKALEDCLKVSQDA